MVSFISTYVMTFSKSYFQQYLIYASTGQNITKF